MTTIFHLTLRSHWLAGQVEGHYVPPGFAREGFVHAAGDPLVAEEVAGSYFSNASEPVIFLEIDVAALDVRWEAPAAPGGAPQKHHVAGRLFPHVYQPIPLTAVVRSGTLEKRGTSWNWLAAMP